MILIRFSQAFLVLFFSLALTGCSFGWREDNKVSNKSSGASSLEEFNSAEIVKEVKGLLDKGKEIPEDLEKKLSEYSAESIVNIYLNAFTEGLSEKYLREIYYLLQDISVTMEDIYTVPSSRETFLFAPKEERRVCFTLVGGHNYIMGWHYYIVQKGNGCNEPSPKLMYENILKKTHDKQRINDVDYIEMQMKTLYHRNYERYSKYVSSIPRDPKTGDLYNIVISPDQQKYCITVTLKSSESVNTMRNDDGNDTFLYERGNGCRELPSSQKEVMQDFEELPPNSSSILEDLERTEDLLDKKEFLESSAKNISGILINTKKNDIREVSEEYREIQNLIWNIPLTFLEVITYPSLVEEFLTTKNEERKACVVINVRNPDNDLWGTKQEVLYSIQEGNACEELYNEQHIVNKE